MGEIGKPRGVARYSLDGLLFIEGYRSISAAANAMGVNFSQISKACSAPYMNKEVAGFKWRYFAYGKSKVQKPRKPKATEAERRANMDAVLDKIIASNKA